MFVFIPIGSVFAAENEIPLQVNESLQYDFKNGLLDDGNLIKVNELPADSYDNNLSSEGRLTVGKKVIEFNYPVDLTAYFIKARSAYSQVGFYYVDSDNKTSVKFLTLSSGNEVNGYFDLDLKNVFKIEIEKGSNGNFYLAEFDLFGTYEKEIFEPVLNLSYDNSYNSVDLNWDNPENSNFNGVIIKKNGDEVANLSRDKTSYTVRGLEPDTEYKFELIAKYSNGGLSAPVKKTIRTHKKPSLDEVKNVEIKAKHDRVDLSWNLPQSEGFHHVNIYRDKIKDPSLLKKIFSGNAAFAASTPIFETNGTYFNDLTVEPKTKYEYTLKTTDGKVESEGVTVQVETPKAPPPEMGGIEGEKQENGDYLFTWGDPADGKVKIIVGGKEYATVPAGNKSFTVPAKDMKYTGLGDPDVSLKPISPTGEEGEATPIKPEFETPFDVKDLLETGTGLLLIIGPFLLLALSILLVPKLRNLIVNAFKSKKGEDGKTRESRETRVPRNERRTG